MQICAMAVACGDALPWLMYASTGKHLVGSWLDDDDEVMGILSDQKEADG